jgi:hypothetical protein
MSVSLDEKCYSDVLNLHEAWAKYEIEKSKVCPEEIEEGYPATIIVDNDDFKDNDLTGGTTSHRTNMIFVQPEHIGIRELVTAIIHKVD